MSNSFHHNVRLDVYGNSHRALALSPSQVEVEPLPRVQKRHGTGLFETVVLGVSHGVKGKRDGTAEEEAT